MQICSLNLILTYNYNPDSFSKAFLSFKQLKLHSILKPSWMFRVKPHALFYKTILWPKKGSWELSLFPKSSTFNFLPVEVQYFPNSDIDCLTVMFPRAQTITSVYYYLS